VREDRVDRVGRANRSWPQAKLRNWRREFDPGVQHRSLRLRHRRPIGQHAQFNPSALDFDAVSLPDLQIHILKRVVQRYAHDSLLRKLANRSADGNYTLLNTLAWQCLEDHPALVTIRRLLECIPDGRLLESLRAARGRGRNDYPVRVLWRVVLLSILLRHKDVEACLGELQRNPTLQEIVGIASTKEIPHGWNVSRFLETLGQEPHRSLLQEVFRVMVQRLGLAVPDLGQHTAGDSTWLNARRTRADARAQKEQAERPAAARKTPARTDKSAGSWSGSASSCICLSIRATKSPWRTRSARRKPATTKCCRAWWTKPRGNLPPARIKTLAYDKAAGCGARGRWARCV
jgi:hypothetical protein